MKICAIRLREVGGFNSAVALEGLSGGLDVLVGPNELGKSTVLRALRAVFYEQHKSSSVKNTKALLHNLRPQSGGAPLVEVDFEIDGRRWRLRKQFLSSRHASLYDLDASHVAARGDDADAKVMDLLKRHPGGAKRDGKLLWLGQREALRVAPPDVGEQEGLRSLIEAQLGEVADGGAARAIRQRVLARLGELVTSGNKKPKAGGAYANALKEHNALSSELEKAQAKANEAQERLEQLHSLAAARRELEDPEVAAARAKHLQQAGEALQVARQAREKLHMAQAVLDKCQLEQEAATKALSVYNTQIKELADLTTQRAAAEKDLAALKEQSKDAKEAVVLAKEKRDTLHRELDEARAALKRLNEFERLLGAKKQLASMQERYAKAKKADSALRSFVDELSKTAVSWQLVDQARTLARALDSADAQLNAAAPRVTIHYEVGGAGKIREAGRALDDGAMLQRESKLVLEIDGIGTIAIEPGANEDLDELREDAAAQRQQLDHCLSLMGVGGLAEAEAALNARTGIEEQANNARSTLEMLAPEGLKALHDDVVRLEEAAVGDVPEEIDTREAASGKVDKLAAEWQAAADKFELLRDRQAGFFNKLAGLDAKSNAQAKQLTILSALLPATSEERSLRHDILVKARAKSERHSNAAQRELDDWRDKAGEDAAYAQLQTTLSQTQSAGKQAQRELSAVKLEIAKTESALQALAQDGAPARVAELREMLDRVQRRVERLSREVAALQMLDEALERGEGATRDTFLGPVLEAIGPYLELVLPGAQLQLGDNLGVTGLERCGTGQPLDLLSAGTQEQIAILVRLGFGRVLARAGAPMPLILDDALVYSDDERISQAFAALQMAAKLHQVIVLTCRSASFKPLGGHQLSLGTWNVDDTAV